MTDPTPLTRLLITEPGVYDDVTDDRYHADPVLGGSLSSSGARALLPPGCPAQFHYDRTQPPKEAAHFDVGKAAHRLVLGAGATLAPIDFDNYQTKAAQQARKDCRAEGLTPLLTHQWEAVVAMADALRRDPIASLLFDPNYGRPEATLVWQDTATGVWCRARLDWLPDRVPGHRMIVPDYKTSAAVDIDALQRACATWRYHQQDSWYRAAVRALGLADDSARFVLVCQSKEPPYLVHVIEMDHVAQRLGDQLNRQALQIYATCRRDGRWPGHADDITQLSLPSWYENAMGAHEL
jgi:hypothetical protein